MDSCIHRRRTDATARRASGDEEDAGLPAGVDQARDVRERGPPPLPRTLGPEAHCLEDGRGSPTEEPVVDVNDEGGGAPSQTPAEAVPGSPVHCQVTCGNGILPAAA